MSNRWIERPNRGWRALVLAALLVVAIIAMLLPERFATEIKGLAQTVLAPAVLPGARCRDLAARAVQPWVARLASDNAQLSGRLQTLEGEVALLQSERAVLVEQLRASDQRLVQNTGDAPSGVTLVSHTEPLLVSRPLTARVLGAQAKAQLAASSLLDQGTRSGVQRGALVIDAPAGDDRKLLKDASTLVDVGSDYQLARGDRVVTSGRIWGQIDTVGARTSTVRRVTDRGYRDLVEIVAAEEDRRGNRPGNRHTAQVRGVLEGTGEPLCRLRFVEVAQPVAVGDLVFAAESQSLGRGSLLYGRVVRAEYDASRSHWEIRVEPATSGTLHDTVAIVRTEVNPTRLTQNPNAAQHAGGVPR